MGSLPRFATMTAILLLATSCAATGQPTELANGSVTASSAASQEIAEPSAPARPPGWTMKPQTPADVRIDEPVSDNKSAVKSDAANEDEEEYGYVEIVKPRAISRDPMFVGVVGYSLGIYEHDVRKSDIDDDVAAQLVRLRTEFVSREGFGGGVSIEATDTDDELFEDSGVVSGEARTFDIFPYAILRLAEEGARLPIRFGPYVNILEIEDSSTTDTRWSSAGIRLEIEPEVILHRRGNNEISLFAELGGGLHFTQIKLDRAGPDEDFDAEGYGLRGLAGIRGRWSGFTASLAYVARYHNVDKSDVEGGQFISEIDTVFRGLFVEVGVRF